jgi:hypothetical protein
MANDCWNWVCFTGKKEDLQRLHEGLRIAESLNAENGGLLWYETFYVALDSEPPEQTVDVYDEFGSKWLDIHDINLSDDSLEFSASSAWSPTSQFFLKLSKVYNLNFESEFEECGNDFGGFFAGSNGEVTDDRTYTYVQYRWLISDFEGIDVDFQDFETEKEAIEYFSSIRELCNPKQWTTVLQIINDYYKEKNHANNPTGNHENAS